MNNNDKANQVAETVTEETVKTVTEEKAEPNTATDNVANTKAKEEAADDNKIVITLPNTLSGDEESRLQALVDSKRSLFTKALETEELPILVKDNTISFPWFTDHQIPGEAEAYAQLITAMIKMAKEQKTVRAKDKQEENEKFAMRIFTVRLGLKGDEYKLIRRLLQHNLSGNSAWKNGKPEKAETKDTATEANTAPEAEQKPKKKATAALPAEKPEKAPEKPNKAAKTGKKAATSSAGKAVKSANVDGANTKKEANDA